MNKIEPRDNSIKEMLEAKIRVLASVSWQDKWDNRLDQLERWLSNFKEEEHVYALFMLSQFMYFSNDAIRELLKRVYEDLFKRPIIFSIRKSNADSVDWKAIDAKFQEELVKTKFLGLGNPSESGSHLLYYFRQENDLKKDLFINAHEIFKFTQKGHEIHTEIVDGIDRLVFIDDFCGSGDQATEYYEQFIDIIKKNKPDIKICYYSLFATEAGIDVVKKLGYYDVKSIFILDSSFVCFSGDSRHFKSKTVDRIDDCKNQCETIAKHYGTQLSKKSPMGHKDCQLLMSFHHNTPNNTLPIFWSEKNSWVPIFKRYNKKY